LQRNSNQLDVPSRTGTSTSTTSTLSSLPSEILLCVFDYLKVGQLLPCQLVSRRFRAITRIASMDRLGGQWLRGISIHDVTAELLRCPPHQSIRNIGHHRSRRTWKREMKNERGQSLQGFHSFTIQPSPDRFSIVTKTDLRSIFAPLHINQ